MKKSILLVFVSLLLTIIVHAQEREYIYWRDTKREIIKEELLSDEEFFEKSELIIEGKFIDYLGSYDAKGHYNADDIYSEYRVLVQRVFKGDQRLKNDTICLVRKGGTIYKKTEKGTKRINSNGDFPPDPKDLKLYISSDFSSILFFTESDFPKDAENFKKCFHQNFKLLQDKEKASLKMFGDNGWSQESSRYGKITGLNDLIFNNREELYEYMKQFEGITIPEK